MKNNKPLVHRLSQGKVFIFTRCTSLLIPPRCFRFLLTSTFRCTVSTTPFKLTMDLSLKVVTSRRFKTSWGWAENGGCLSPTVQRTGWKPKQDAQDVSPVVRVEKPGPDSIAPHGRVRVERTTGRNPANQSCCWTTFAECSPTSSWSHATIGRTKWWSLLLLTQENLTAFTSLRVFFLKKCAYELLVVGWSKIPAQ